jgi:hypothetical protein
MNFLQRLIGGALKRPAPQQLPNRLQPNDPLAIAPAQRSHNSTIFNTPMRFNNGPVFNPLFHPAPVTTPHAMSIKPPPPQVWHGGGAGLNGMIRVPQNPHDRNTAWLNLTPRQALTTNPQTGQQIPGDINIQRAINPHPQFQFRTYKAAPYYIDPMKQQQVQNLQNQPRII